jgi:hypothetical protein
MQSRKTKRAEKKTRERVLTNADMKKEIVTWQ